MTSIGNNELVYNCQAIPNSNLWKLSKALLKYKTNINYVEMAQFFILLCQFDISPIEFYFAYANKAYKARPH